MADFEIKVRNLETGEMLVATMPDAESCIEWLKERPKNVEIVSVLSETSPVEQKRLKDAMRPYDEDELELKEEYDRKASAAAAAAYGQELETIENAQALSEEELEKLDPNRPLAVKYELDEGLTVVDDNRELTDAARAACLAWVNVRNGWIEGNGQIVGEAHLEVWPNDCPDGEDKRVLEGGRFFPRLAN